MRMLSEDVAAAGQITAADVARIKEAGFRAIVCNRPDGEGFGQTPYRDIEQAAQAAGIEIRYHPVSAGRMTVQDAVEFNTLMNELPRPILAYCASGARASMLFMMAQQQHPTASLGHWR